MTTDRSTPLPPLVKITEPSPAKRLVMKALAKFFDKPEGEPFTIEHDGLIVEVRETSWIVYDPRIGDD